MKNFKSLKAAAIYMLAAFVGVISFVSCQKDEVTGHDNNGNNALAVKVKGDSVKPDPKPEDVYRNDTITEFRNDSVIVIIDYYKNDTIIDTKNYGALVSASISREFDKLQTTEARIRNLDFTFGEVSSSTNGKNQVIGRQAVQDGDGQNYNGQTTSGKIFDIYAELVSFKKTNLKNTELEPGKDEARLLNTNITWLPVVRIVNAPNLKGQTFELTSKTTEHLRYIPKNAPEFVKYDDWKVWKETGNWNTVWHFECNEYWSNDSVAPKSKLTTLNGSYSKIELSDKIVSNLDDYTHPVGTLVWGNWYGVESKDTGVTLREKKGTKKSLATNGFDADKFNTEFSVTMQEADVMFCDSLFHVSSDEASLTTKRNIFAEATSDMEGYSMVKFVDEEIAKWNGQYDVTLDEQCKLYMKIDSPDPKDPDYDYILVKNSDYKNRTQSEVKVGLEIQALFEDGTKGSVKSFSMERYESWTWKGDSVIFENVDFFMQETASKLELVGSLKKTAKTQRDNGGVFSFNEYEGDFRTKVTSNGMTKYTTWHAIWSEDFSFTYTDENGKTFSHTFDKSDYSVKAQNSSLKKNESKSSVTSEVYDYSVDGIFAIDNVNRSAAGYGRFQKSLDEVIVRIYWDEASKGQSHTVLESTRWATLVREYNTGRKTTQEYRHVFNRLSNASQWEVSAEEGKEIATTVLSIENTNDNERTDDFAHFTLKKFELGQFFDIEGAAQQHDKVTFTESMGVYFEVKDQDGNPIRIFFEDPSYSFNNNVKDLVVVKEATEADPFTQYKHENVVNWNYGGATTTVSATGLINVEAYHGGGEPDFDLTVSKYFAAVCRPSNRDAADITAYTCLLIDEEAMKCLAIGFYNGMITKGEVEDYVEGMNSACFVKNENRIVATTCTLANGIIKYRDGNGNLVDAGTFLQWQGAGFNDRGNDWVNHTGQYIPYATNQGGVCVVGFSGSSRTITVTGWQVK